MNRITDTLVDALLAQAEASARRRAIHCFHRPEEYLQRMVNACLRGTYVRPHRHKNPDKLEVFYCIRGRAAIVFFDDGGAVRDCAIIDERGPCRSTEIAPGEWHSFVALADEAAFFEIIEGHYEALTHKHYAPWAPAEDDSAAAAYLDGIIDILRKRGDIT